MANVQVKYIGPDGDLDYDVGAVIEGGVRMRTGETYSVPRELGLTLARSPKWEVSDNLLKDSQKQDREFTQQVENAPDPRNVPRQPEPIENAPPGTTGEGANHQSANKAPELEKATEDAKEQAGRSGTSKPAENAGEDGQSNGGKG